MNYSDNLSRMLEFSPYENLLVTTQTFVVHTKLRISLEHLYEIIQCVPVNQSYKKKKFDMSKETLGDGDIVYAQFNKNSKGMHRDVHPKQMLNVVTVLIKLGAKLYNIKIARSGKFQFTGCKSIEPVLFNVRLLLNMLWNANLLKTFDGTRSPNVETFIICVMSNVTIHLPFRIDRDKLHHYINESTEHISMLEKSEGYVGVNIKIKSDRETKENTTIKKVVFDMNQTTETIEDATFADYLISCELKGKKYKTEMYNSFLTFESGKTIMSGCASYKNRKDAYEIFGRIISEAQHIIML